MLLPEVAHASGFDLAVFDRVLDCAPAVQPCLLPTIWTVQEKKIYIAEPTLLHALADTSPRSTVVTITGQLRCVVDIFSLERGMAFQVVEHSMAHLFLVVIHLCRVHGSVTRVESMLDGCRGFAAGHQVHAKMDLGHGQAIVELDARRKGRCTVRHGPEHLRQEMYTDRNMRQWKD